MSDTPDPESRTEPATEKRVQDAIDDGNTPISREASTFALLLASFGAASFLVTDAGSRVSRALIPLLENPGGWSTQSGADVLALLRVVLGDVAISVTPIFLLLASSGIAISLVHGAPRIAAKRIKPDPSRISPIKGWNRLFRVQSAIELWKACLKLGVIATIGLWMMLATWGTLQSLLDLDVRSLPGVLTLEAGRLLGYVALFGAVLLAVDLVLVRSKWRKDLRMTRQQVKDEHRQSDGDPLLKSRRRAISRERSRRRTIAAVPTATIVIANPTHFAVALRYARSTGGAPVVVAKGQDLIAITIRKVAEAHRIPVVEDKGLARSLYAQVEVGQQIPAEFYRAIANVFVVLRERGRIRLE